MPLASHGSSGIRDLRSQRASAIPYNRRTAPHLPFVPIACSHEASREPRGRTNLVWDACVCAPHAASKVGRPEQLLVELFLGIATRLLRRWAGRVPRALLRYQRALQPCRVRWLQHRTLLRHHRGERLVGHLEVAAAIAHVGGREPIECNPPLMRRAPRRGAVHSRLRPDDDVACARHRLVDVLSEVLARAVGHVGWHRKVELVRAADDAEAAVARRVVAQLHGYGEQARPQLATGTAVLQLRVEAPAGGDGPAMQRKALRVLVLRDQQRLVVQSVPRSAQGRVVRQQLRVRKHATEYCGTRCGHVTQRSWAHGIRTP
mmetsp:Transcript_38370/g.112337  ORF Transcript_38370/g.112337 Transcript_38370/m.112337 type:complete len:318 (-) Transcript_38370:2-955(-)